MREGGAFRRTGEAAGRLRGGLRRSDGIDETEAVIGVEEKSGGSISTSPPEDLLLLPQEHGECGGETDWRSSPRDSDLLLLARELMVGFM